MSVDLRDPAAINTAASSKVLDGTTALVGVVDASLIDLVSRLVSALRQTS
jgi:hypothetical protein